MIIIPIRGKKDIDLLIEENDVFDLAMKTRHEQYYLIIQDNTVTWIGEGTVPGKAAIQIKSRSTTMNGRLENPKNHGNIGFLGTYSNTKEALKKIFPTNGFAVSNMKYVPYTGQDLTAKEDHWGVIDPIFCLLGGNPSSELHHFFEKLGWGGRKRFSCTGTWGRMRLYIEDHEVSSLEEWFHEYCITALNPVDNSPASASADKTETKAGSKVTDILGYLFWIIVLIAVLRSCS